MSDLRELLGDRYEVLASAISEVARGWLGTPFSPHGWRCEDERYPCGHDVEMAGEVMAVLGDILPGLLAQAWKQGRYAEQRYQEPCLLHDITGEDVPGWEMAECTCEDLANPYREDAGNESAREDVPALVAEIERLTGEPTEDEVEVGAREIWRWFVGPNLDGFYRHAYAYDREKCMDACRAALRAARGLS